MRQDFDYLQPDYFHFSQDSVILAKLVAAELNDPIDNIWAMDVGSGCGIVGLEILKRIVQKVNFDFLELQKDFFPYFQKNKSLVGEKSKYCNFYLGDFRDHPIERKYSIMVSNPPYFPVEHNKLGPDPRRNKCRFFKKGSYFDLLDLFRKGLKIDGKGYFLLRTSEQWGKDTLCHLKDKFGDFFQFKDKELDEKTSLIILNVLNINGN